MIEFEGNLDLKDYETEEILSIESSKNYTYDLEIEDEHHYILDNGMVTHNSLSFTVEAGGSGIEPIFGKYYVRRERSTTGEWKEWFTFNDLVIQELTRQGLEVTKENADNLDPNIWKTAHSVDNLSKIKLLGVIQRYIDSSISVTYNLPEDCTVEEIEEIYMEAWKNELKGVTVYREGSLAGVMTTEANYNKTKLELEEQEKKDKKNKGYTKRPEILECDIHEVRYRKEPYLILVGLHEDTKEPYEIFATKNVDKEIDVEKHKKGYIRKTKKKGKNVYSLHVQNGEDKTYIKDIIAEFDSVYGTLGRLLSLNLREGVIPLQLIVQQLQKENNFVGFDRTVARVLKKYIKEGEKVIGSATCPQCGSTNLAYQGGCTTCLDCGMDKCD